MIHKNIKLHSSALVHRMQFFMNWESLGSFTYYWPCTVSCRVETPSLLSLLNDCLFLRRERYPCSKMKVPRHKLTHSWRVNSALTAHTDGTDLLVKYYLILISVIIERWPKLLQKFCPFAEYLNYCSCQIRKAAIKLITRC